MFTLILFLLPGAFAHAQQPHNEALVEVPEVRFCTVDSVDVLPELYYRTIDGYELLNIPSLSRSSAYRLNTSAVNLFRRVNLETGEVSYEQVASGVLPAAGRDVLAIVEVSPDERITLNLIDDSLEAFPLNTVRFVNNTVTRLAGVLHGTKFVLEPEKLVTVPFEYDQSVRLEVKIAAETQNGWKPLTSTRSKVRENMRMICFGSIVKSPTGEYSFILQTMVDFPKPLSNG